MTFVHFLYLVVVAGVTYFLYRKRIVFAVIFAAFAAFFGTTIFTGVGFNARFGPDWIVPVILGLVSAFFASVGVGSFRWTLKHWRWFLVVGLVPCACVAILYIYMGAAQFQNRPVYIEPTITETEEPTLEPTEAAEATKVEATEIRLQQVASEDTEPTQTSQPANTPVPICREVTGDTPASIFGKVDDEAVEGQEIDPGTEVIIVDDSEPGWMQVILPSGKEVWMMAYQLSEDTVRC